MNRVPIILFVLSCILLSSKVVSQKRYAIKELDYNVWSYKYAASANSFSPKSQAAVYWKPMIDVSLYKIVGTQRIRKDYTVNKKVVVLFATDTITGNIDSTFVDAYLIHFEKEIKAASGMQDDSIMIYEVPRFKHPYTAFAEKISDRDILITGVFKMPATISKEEKEKIVMATNLLKQDKRIRN